MQNRVEQLENRVEELENRGPLHVEELEDALGVVCTEGRPRLAWRKIKERGR